MIHSDKTRDCEAHAIIGGNKQGKSSLVAELIADCYDKRKQKVIVLNSSNPIPFQPYLFASNKKALQRKWNGVVRYHNPEGYVDTLNDVYDLVVKGYVKGGAIVFDDCTKYMGSNPPQAIKDFLVDRAMYNLDIFFTTHAIRFLPKFVRGMVNTITVFKTAEVYEKPEELKVLEYPNYTALYHAWKGVMNAPQSKSFIQPHDTITTGI